MASKAERRLRDVNYHGEKRNWTFEKYVTVHKEQHHVLTNLEQHGYKPYLCKDEDEARTLMASLPEQGMWPCLFTESDTTGEKDFEEFFTDKEVLDMARFENLPAGQYALAIVHDENGNNKLDTFAGIPKEGYGFSRNPGFKPRAPKFAEAEVQVQGASTAAIKLRYIL